MYTSLPPRVGPKIMLKWRQWNESVTAPPSPYGYIDVNRTDHTRNRTGFYTMYSMYAHTLKTHRDCSTVPIEGRHDACCIPVRERFLHSLITKLIIVPDTGAGQCT